MKILLRAVLALIVVIVLLLGVGLLLPASFKVERSAQIQAPAAVVYALIATPKSWSSWAVWNQRDPDMKLSYSGPETGVGAAWSWESATEGNGEMKFTDATVDQQVVYQLSFPDFGMSSTGKLSLTPRGEGVEVRWSNEGEVGWNPINRWFVLFMDRLVGPDFEAGLSKLREVAVQQALQQAKEAASEAAAATVEPTAAPLSAAPPTQTQALPEAKPPQ